MPESRTPLSLEQATRLLTAPGADHEIVECDVGGCVLRCWKHVPSSLRELWLRGRSYGEREFLVYQDERLTYGEAFARSARLAQALRRLGVEKGDRIAIAMRNYPQWPLSFFAATSIGAIAVPLNAWWKGEELAYGLSDSGCKVLIADGERVAALQAHWEALPLSHLIVAHGEPPGGLARPAVHRFDELVAGASERDELPDVALEPEDDATIFYTSGTTGHPKGALGTHRNLLTNIGSVGFVRARAALRKGDAVTDPSEPGKTILVSVPLFHVTGCHSMLAVGVNNGHKLVFMYKWNAEQALELIERERVTQFGGVPAMVWQVLESPDFGRRDTSSVAIVGYGGAPAAPELVRRIKAAYPEGSPSNGYGLTETSAVTTSNVGLDYERKPDSVGLPVPVCDVKVVSDDGRELGPGQVGELWVRGPNVVKGYWNKPEATQQSFGDHWLKTGDVVSRDEEGFITILDRAKDMLIRGGENIYCVEVENVLYQHPEVMDAAVIGLPHRVLGEEVGAVVQVTAGARVSESELKAHAAAHLASFKVPIRIQLRTEPLPRNANGKILKRELREQLTQG